jgi:hypothetical protein
LLNQNADAIEQDDAAAVNGKEANASKNTLADTHDDMNGEDQIIPEENADPDEIEAIENVLDDEEDDSDMEDEIISYGIAMLMVNEAPLYHMAMAGPDKKRWKEACLKEFESLKSNQVLSEPCELPKGFQALDTKMVLKLKEAEHSHAARRYKARLCGRGFRQTYGVNYFNTYAPVATYTSLRLFVGIMATMDYEMDTVDVTTAFLHSPIKEEIYIKIPDGYPIEPRKPNMVLKLQKCLYGLKQAPMEWNSEIDSHLQELGFKPYHSDPCIYARVNKGIPQYILVYVDDMIIATKGRVELSQIKQLINRKFPSSDKGPIQKFLNVHFERNRGDRIIAISQPVKIENVLKDPQLSKKDLEYISKPTKLPANPSIKLTKDMGAATKEVKEEMKDVPYKSILGQLLYISITARPDISTAVSHAGKFAKDPGPAHWQAILQILKYLQGTRRKRLVLGSACNTFTLTGYSDADWGGDLEGRKSRTGTVVMINNWPIIWTSKLQQSVSTSSTGAEYIALSSTAREIIASRIFLSEFGFKQRGPTTIFEDNNSCIAIANGQKRHPGIKHIDIAYHFIKERIKRKEIELKRKPTGEMIADLFTKNLAANLFQRHTQALQLL